MDISFHQDYTQTYLEINGELKLKIKKTVKKTAKETPLKDKIPKKEKTPLKEPLKSKKKKGPEPWVKVLNMDVNPNNPKNGFFELDWNKEFVNMLQQNGYKGETEEQIVDKWFQTLCRTIGNEQGVDVPGSGYVQINRRDDGKTEVS